MTKTKPKTNARTLTMTRPTRVARTDGQQRSDRLGKDARLNISLPVSLHAKVKIRATERLMSIRDYIIELLRADGVE